MNRARAKFPSTDCLFMALSEELGELARELDMDESQQILERVRAEAVQVACVAMRIYLEGTTPGSDHHVVFANAKIGEAMSREFMAQFLKARETASIQ
jgi:hypothetical protein